MILEIKDIHKSFSGTEVLHGVSFSITSGKAMGFLGRNGAGKTTTIRILMGLFDANDGEILLDGKKFNPREHSIGYLPEERGLYPKQKVLDQLTYFGELRGLSKKSAKENTLFWLERLGVSEYKDKKLETLSKGNQQKVQIVETLICNPDIIILDEPFSGLDPVNSQILKDVISELIDKGKLVIFSSHQMSYVEEFCEEIALIDKGNIVLTGSLKAIKKEYGRNRMTLSSSNQSLDELHNLLSSKVHGINIAEAKNGHLIIELLNGKSKKDLLNDLISLDIDVERFSIYEPSLTDIFVEKVGDK
ncbi:ATP-binding cassette domain-containing protein [Tissierella sp.]|uniref:ABC transporter ATP-binding protein n=1 Tax=Tissierella sp. TaxID=41274 RepID=UPI00286788C5|nr:ATP-binding cassette domain-containing protein [Tissierella sp.]MDR7857475.1 ATP-binding cassette domain-containing protein [Tissierella sp.]